MKKLLVIILFAATSCCSQRIMVTTQTVREKYIWGEAPHYMLVSENGGDLDVKPELFVRLKVGDRYTGEWLGGQFAESPTQPAVEIHKIPPPPEGWKR